MITALRMACLMGAGVCLWIGFSVPERGGDFDEFYSASKLAGSGHLYDWDRLQRLERENETIVIPFGRLPVYAGLMKPLAGMRYPYARGAWLAVNLAALILFALLWPGRRHAAVAMLCWSCPAAILLSTGQDTGLFLLFVTLGLRLLQSRQDFAAGLVFSLCAAKPHLALGIPVFLLARRRWGAMAGGLAGGAVQVAASFAIEGRDWLAQLARLASISEFSPAPAKMPNLLGLTHWLPSGMIVEALLGIVVFAAAWRIARRRALATGATAAVLAGLLASHHAYVYDAVLLLPALLLALRLRLKPVEKYWVLLLCVPIPYLFLMKDYFTLVAQIAINGFCLSFLAWLAMDGMRQGVRKAAPAPV